MSNVQFDDQQQVRYAPKTKGLGGLVISWGLAKDQKGAHVVLLVVLVVAVVIGFATPAVLGGNSESQVSQFEIDQAFEI